jgi:2-C-methyl-D-erythritol 4-phosphate cytidylyltransferase/2-C-methyl-D-erythritol 2,4-cyclodiphosphate synthase
MVEPADPAASSLPSKLKVAVVLVAAGRGTRARAAEDVGQPPKQYRRIGGRSVLALTAEAFLAEPSVSALVAAIHPDDAGRYSHAASEIRHGSERLRPPVVGGADRQASVRAGLESLADHAPDLVLIHDAVRPFVSGQTIRDVIAALRTDDAVCTGVPVVDTVQRADGRGYVVETVRREGLWRAATPQAFRYSLIAEAHRRAAAEGVAGLTDDAAVASWAGHRVRMIPCEDTNVKLTTPHDYAAAEARIGSGPDRLGDIRTGMGYDVHALEPGDAVVLGGVAIPHTHRLKGHSDADVALHALTDAILGAIGEGDIGQHFPPSDPQWRGAPSRLFLADAVRRVRARGGAIANVDVTIVAEAPKVGPHREAMQAAIAEACGIAVDRVGVKATTNEGLGFAGRREGIAALATATVRLPWN